MSLGARTWSHADSQNLAVQPSLIMTVVLTLKSCLSASLHGTFIPTHGMSRSVHWYQSHLNRNARLNNSRSSTPSPPRCLGLFTLVHLTKQWPPLASSDPFHKKLLLILSMRLTAHVFGAKAVRKYTGIEVRTVLTSFEPSPFVQEPALPCG
jgi:hypothetical protein